MLEPLVDKVVQVITNDGRNIVGLLKVPAQPRTPPDAAAVPYLIASSATKAAYQAPTTPVTAAYADDRYHATRKGTCPLLVDCAGAAS